jgi:hypothetical protein
MDQEMRQLRKKKKHGEATILSSLLAGRAPATKMLVAHRAKKIGAQEIALQR